MGEEMSYREKLDLLCKDFQSLGKVLIAFSGGVDSSLLVKSAWDVLGKNAIAVTVRSSLFPEREFKEAHDFCLQLGIEHREFFFEGLEDPEFVQNPPNRCYICKKRLFKNLKEYAREQGLNYVVEGSNIDDTQDYRPGRQALRELGIKSPLLKAGFTKKEIRLLSQELGLSTWDKPSGACLASRIPYGSQITREKLKMIDAAEQYLLELGFKQVRVRHHEKIARIEILPEEFSRIIDSETAAKISKAFAEIGFTYNTLDLKGYRTGSLSLELT
jgi:uncharacterized protein